MESLGLATPSILKISINFRTHKNEPQMLKKICVRPQILQNDFNTDKILEHDFFFEKEAPFILLSTNLCERPLKLLIDTGAAVSIIVNDIIKEETHKINYHFSLFGIAGKDMSVTTEGMVHGIFNLMTHLWVPQCIW